MRVRSRIRSRTSSGAATTVLWSCCKAARRDLTAVFRVVRSTRRASIALQSFLPHSRIHPTNCELRLGSLS